MKVDRFSITRLSNQILGNRNNSNSQRHTATFTISDNDATTNATNGTTVDIDNHTVSTVSSASDGKRPSFGYLTREPLPRLEYYRTSKRAIKRPSLGELHGDLDRKPESKVEDDKPDVHGHGIKLGWIEGVLIPCLLNIWGVMLFLRLSWVVSQAGIIESLVIIVISYLVCVITALSLSAICTNGQVKGGGIYYLISRSLGPEFGASVGIVFAFANSVAASLNTIGFCNSLNDLLKTFDAKIIDGGVNDVRIVGTVAIIIMVIICAVGMEWEAKAQNFLIVTIVVAIFNFLIGVLVGPTSDEKISQGFIGFSKEVFAENLQSDYRWSENSDHTFFTVFAIFFPSVTGVQAGANICGDLKDPATAIPKGTLLALLISAISYVLFVFFAGGAALRDASGNITDYVNGTFPSCAAEGINCAYGLHNDYTVMQLMSLSSYIIYAGCFAATLSTALTNLLSVPRIIQALGIDRIYPGLIFFSKGYGKHGEPYRGYVLVLLISVLFVLIADINAIAPLISNFYLASYALINFCTFHAAIVKPLGWRPTFRFYNPWLSLVGSVGCIAIMFKLDYTFTAVTIVVIFILYLVVVYRKPDVNWGSSTQQQTYKSALSSTLKLQTIGDHVKNYHPSVLVLAGNPMNRPPLIDMANLITKNHSLMIVGDIIEERLSYRKRQEQNSKYTKFLEIRKIRGFYQPIDGLSFEDGVHALIQTSGVGKLSPNIVMMGFKSDWMTCPVKNLLKYYNVLHDAFDCRMAISILRLPNGLDFSHLNTEIVSTPSNDPNTGGHPNHHTISTIAAEGLKPPTKLMHVDSNLNLDSLAGSNHTTLTIPQPTPLSNRRDLLATRDSIIYSTRGGSFVDKEILDRMGVFQKKQPKGTIDVWWLYDDGGLTMLVPYIISMRSKWAHCKIRVFALTNQQMELEVEERNMANLLMKLRINYSSLTMLQGVMDAPQQETVDMHERLLKNFHKNDGTEIPISDTEQLALQEKTNRQLRLREMLIEHSNSANLIVMSMPMPRLGTVSAPLYMSWLEMLTKDMPPFMLVRGNQTSVLTFYS